MDKISILHLSDLHMIGSPNGNNMKRAIWDFAKEHFAKLPKESKLLVLTGDFHNFTDTDYKSADFISTLCEKMGIELSEDVFVVPGNHDVDRASTGDTFRKLAIRAVRGNPPELNTDGQARNDYMTKFLSFYEGYQAFVKELGIYSDDDMKQKKPVSVHVRTWRNRLHLLHLNTALIADGNNPDGSRKKQMTDTLSVTTDEIQEQIEAGGLPCIALGHNNLYDMYETQWQEGIRGAFRNVSAYLCGDRHETDIEPRERTFWLGSNSTIPNLCAPRGSADNTDKESQLGLLLHEWDMDTSKAKWTLYTWNRRLANDPLKADISDTYDIIQRSKADSKPPGKSDAAETAKTMLTLRQQVEAWELGGAAELLDAEAVQTAAKEFEADKDGRNLRAFYRVNDSYGVMLRVLAAGEGIPRKNDEAKITELLERGPVLITGNGGMGKTTLMLMTAIRWANAGGVAVWLNLRDMGRIPDDKARACMETLRLWAEQGRRVLLCMDSPGWGRDALSTLRAAWMNENLWAGRKTDAGGFVQLLMAERDFRLRSLTGKEKGFLLTWFDRAGVVELRHPRDRRRASFQMGNEYPPEILAEEPNFRKKLLVQTAKSYIQSGTFSSKDGQRLSAELDAVIADYDGPNVSIVELIYRALFALQGIAKRAEKVVLDWEEWGRTLRSKFQLADGEDDFELYGGIAAFGLFGQSMPLALFCRRFDLPPQKLTNLLRDWHISKRAGSVEPVIYEPSGLLGERRGNWGVLQPKHEAVAELFFLFRDDEDYEDSDFDRLLAEYLDIMSEPEIEALFHELSERDVMKQLKRRDIVRVHYRELVKVVYERIRKGELGLSEPGRLDLCLTLIWSNDGARMTAWDAEAHEILEDIAPELERSHTLSVLYTAWGQWLSGNRKDTEAVDKFRKAIAIDPKNLHPHTELGKLLARQGKDDEAEKLFREALELAPKDIPSRTELGKLLARQGKDDEAEKLFREAAKIDPKNIPPRQELGRLLERAGRAQEAEAWYNEILTIKPTDKIARDSSKRLRDVT